MTQHQTSQSETDLLPSRRTALIGAAALGTLGLSAAPRGHARATPAVRFAGVNISGAEFGKIPGRINHDYIYADRLTLKAYAQQGFNIVRIPFRWERIQPIVFGPLATAELSKLKELVLNCDEIGLRVILDLHNYARRYVETDAWQGDYLIGTSFVPLTALEDVWSRIAVQFVTHPSIVFGLMNEPHGLSADTWLLAANKTIAAIRATDAANLIMVPGVAFTGAHSWITAGNGVLANVTDPKGNYAIEVHQYLDADSSGTSPHVVSPTVGSERIAAFETWARQNQIRAFLGEFAAPSSPEGLAALTDLCRTMERSPDVWLGWTAWSAGAWWPDDYMFKLDPKKDGMTAKQTAILSTFARRMTHRS